MSVEEMQAWAREHYGDATEEGEDDAVEEESDDDYFDDYNDKNWVEDLIDRGFSLWAVRCGNRKERVNVKKIKRRVRQLKKNGTVGVHRLLAIIGIAEAGIFSSCRLVKLSSTIQSRDSFGLKQRIVKI